MCLCGVCGLVNNVVRFFFKCDCCVFVSVLFHVSVRVVCEVLCGVVWFVFVCVVFACACSLFKNMCCL